MNSTNQEDRQAIYNVYAKFVNVYRGEKLLGRGDLWVSCSYIICAVDNIMFDVEDILYIDDRIGVRDVYLK